MFKYGHSDFPAWSETDEGKKLAVLHNLFSNGNKVTGKNGEQNIFIRKEESLYTVTLKIETKDNTRTFRNEFSTLASVAKFIHGHTYIDMCDLSVT